MTHSHEGLRAVPVDPHLSLASALDVERRLSLAVDVEIARAGESCSPGLALPGLGGHVDRGHLVGAAAQQAALGVLQGGLGGAVEGL